MQYIEAPNTESAKFKSVFLAGGISDCPNWQKDVAESLTDIDVTVYNPRRYHYPITEILEAEEQIRWEYERLRKADIILFWFSPETLNPITLFEYGSALERDQKLFVGVDFDYKRKTDIEIQTKIRRPEIILTYSVKVLSQVLSEYLKM